MSQDKAFRTLNAKLDALLVHAGIKPEDVTPTEPAARPPRKLTPAEQQAIDNAPKPTPVAGLVGRGPRVTQTNAPSVAGSVPPDAVGKVTVETKEADGDTKVETKPASEARRK